MGGVCGGVAARGQPRPVHTAGPQSRRVHRHGIRYQVPGEVRDKTLNGFRKMLL